MGETQTVKVELPKELVERLGRFPRIVAREVREHAILDLFRQRQLTMGGAAEALGMSVADFMVFASSRGVPVVTYDPGELDREVALLEEIHGPALHGRSRHRRADLAQADSR
jgi:predicted HTH domain antitoxin